GGQPGTRAERARGPAGCGRRRGRSALRRASLGPNAPAQRALPAGPPQPIFPGRHRGVSVRPRRAGRRHHSPVSAGEHARRPRHRRAGIGAAGERQRDRPAQRRLAPARLSGGWLLLKLPIRAFAVGMLLAQALALALALLAFAVKSLLLVGAVLFGITVGNVLMLQPLLLAE